MKNVLKALKGARLIAKGVDHGYQIRHYLLTNGQVLEIARKRRA